MQAGTVHPLIEETMKKAIIAWLSVPGEVDAYAIWCMWANNALYVVSGGEEQPAPGLARGTTVDISARGDHGGRVVTWPATVATVSPGTPEWDEIVPQMAGKRLNASGDTDAVVLRWSRESLVSRLTPAADPIGAGDTLPDSSGAAPPRPTPAARRTANPFRLHRVRRN